MGLYRSLTQAARRTKRDAFVLRLRMQALRQRARLQLDIARDIEVRSRIRVEIAPGTTNSITIGTGSRLLGDNLIRLVNGTLEFGERVEVRRGTVINVTGGTLRCEGNNKLSYYNVLHCSMAITLEQFASTSEFCSIIDVTHNHDGGPGPFFENEESAPIHIGANTWMGSKSTVVMGVTVGRDCVIAAHAVVTKDVADGDVVGGVPARVIASRPMNGEADRTATRSAR